MIRAQFVHGVFAVMLVTTACGAPAPAQAPPTASPPSTAPVSENAPPSGRVVLLTIDGNRVRGPEVVVEHAVATLTIKQGENVTLRWSSPGDAMIHLHGYDLKASIPAGGSADMPVLARATGRFAVEFHGGAGHVGTPILYVQVIP